MRFIRTLALAGLAVVTLSACADLAVTNQNQPDRERAISTPGDVASLVLGGFRSWHTGTFNRAPNIAFAAIANEHAASWGNFGMNDLRRQPREAFNNDPSYSYSYVAGYPWTQMYAALSGIRDGLIAIDGGIEIGPNGEDTQATVAFARFVQGLALGNLALNHDQAFILDENTDLENAQLEPYAAVQAAAIQRLEEAIALAGANTFSIDAVNVGGFPMSNTMMGQLAHSMIAFYMASTPRSPAERDAVNWAAIESHVNAGFKDNWLIQGEGVGGPSVWGDWTKTWGGSYSSWSRMDVEWIGPADQSGEFQAWRATPVQQRNAILIDTPDRRINGAGGSQDSGLYADFMGVNSSAFRPERGTYTFSDYRDQRHDAYGDNWDTAYSIMTPGNMDFLKAEAIFRQGGRTAEVLALINPYRTGNGELPAAEADGAQGDANCVPKSATGACGDLWETLKYEKRIEMYHYMGGTAYFDDRGWGDLITGSPIHLPVPGDELLVLLMDIYTFGGVGGSGSAPVSGVEFNLTLDDITTEELAARARALETFRMDYGAKFDAVMR
jgi:hypothetical protein